jgi:hypothetical protein
MGVAQSNFVQFNTFDEQFFSFQRHNIAQKFHIKQVYHRFRKRTFACVNNGGLVSKREGNAKSTTIIVKTCLRTNFCGIPKKNVIIVQH